MTSLSIQLDEPTRTFVAGDTVEGKVVVTRETGFATPLKFTSFKLECTSELFIRVRAAPGRGTRSPRTGPDPGAPASPDDDRVRCCGGRHR